MGGLVSTAWPIQTSVILKSQMLLSSPFLNEILRLKYLRVQRVENLRVQSEVTHTWYRQNHSPLLAKSDQNRNKILNRNTIKLTDD